jgi:DNA topoisomerase-1
MPAADLDLEQALKLLSLPREVGLHPETKEPITAGIGRFGPYIKVGKVFKSLPKGDDVLTIGLNHAVSLLAEAQAKAAPLRTIGEHPADKGEITLHKGRFGPYLAWNNIRATLPRSVDADQLTVEQAAALLTAKASSAKGGKGAKGKPRRGAKAPAAAKAPAKAKPAKTDAAATAAKPAKKAAKKPAAKKPAAKKPAAKKPASAAPPVKKAAAPKAPAKKPPPKQARRSS